MEVGYSQDSKLPAEFDITAACCDSVAGEHVLSVRVFKLGMLLEKLLARTWFLVVPIVSMRCFGRYAYYPYLYPGIQGGYSTRTVPEQKKKWK